MENLTVESIKAYIEKRIEDKKICARVFEEQGEEALADTYSRERLWLESLWLELFDDEN